MDLTLVLFFEDFNFDDKLLRFHEIKNQTKKSYKLIFINGLTNKKYLTKFYEVVNGFSKSKRPTVIDGFSPTTLMEAYNIALKCADTNYIYFASSSGSLSNEFCEELLTIIEDKKNRKRKIDIINFTLKLNDEYDSSAMWPEKFPVYSIIKEQKSIFAYIDPFLATKIFRLKFLHRNELNFSIDIRQDCFFLYKVLNSAYDFYFLKKALITKVKNKFSDTFSLMSLYDQWELIIKYFKINNNFDLCSQELEYAFLRFFYFYVWYIVYNNCNFNKIHFNELYSRFNALLKDTFQHQDLNIYLNLQNNLLNNYIKNYLVSNDNFKYEDIFTFAKKINLKFK